MSCVTSIPFTCVLKDFFAGPCPGQCSRIICEVWFNHGVVSSIQSIDTGGVAKNADPPIQGGLDDSFGEVLYLNLRLTNKLWDWHISKPPSLKPLKRSKQRDQLLFHLEPEWCQKDFFHYIWDKRKLLHVGGMSLKVGLQMDHYLWIEMTIARLRRVHFSWWQEFSE